MVLLSGEEISFAGANREEETKEATNFHRKDTEKDFPPASTVIHIPVSHLKDKINLSSETQKVASTTNTRIDSYELPQYGKIRFNIFGKWRDTFHAGRLLWYSLTRHFTVYVHSRWWPDLDRKLPDQNGKPFSKLYRGVSFRLMEEFNLIAISGPCWDVLKVRKELFRRRVNNEEMDMVGFENNRNETIALQVLKSIKSDIHEDPVRPSDSLYYLKNSQVLQLLTGPKVLEKKTKSSPEAVVKERPCATESCNSQQQASNLEAEINKLEIIEVPDSPVKPSRLIFQDNDFLAIKPARCGPQKAAEQIETKFLEEVFDGPVCNGTKSNNENEEDIEDGNLTQSVFPIFQQSLANTANSELKKHIKSILQLLNGISVTSLDEESKTLLLDLEQYINHVKLCTTSGHLSTPLKELLAKDLMADLCSKSVPKRYSRMRANCAKSKANSESDRQTMDETDLTKTCISQRTGAQENSYCAESKDSTMRQASEPGSPEMSPSYSFTNFTENQTRSLHASSNSKSSSLDGLKAASPTLSRTSSLETFSPTFSSYRHLDVKEVRAQLSLSSSFSKDDQGKERIVQRLRQLISQAGNQGSKASSEAGRDSSDESKAEVGFDFSSCPPKCKGSSYEDHESAFRCPHSRRNSRPCMTFPDSSSSPVSSTSLTQLPLNLTTLVNALKRTKHDFSAQYR